MTEAEFLRFLRHGGSEVAVIAEIEFAYESGGSIATSTIYFADRPEAVAGSQKYHDAIESAPELERSIDLARLGGRGGRTVGSITLCNADGAFDWLLDVIIDGRDAHILIGGEGWGRADYRTLAKGAVAAVRAPNDNEIVIELRDKNFLLDDTIIGDTISAGPNAGKPKPLLLGRVRNFDIAPYLSDPGSLKYFISNFPLSTSVEPNVRDIGLSLREDDLFFMDSGSTTADIGTETINHAGHTLNVNDVIKLPSSIFGLTAGLQYWVINVVAGVSFQLSLTKGGTPVNLTVGTIPGGSHAVSRRRYYIHHADGMIELSGEPAGRVTVDMFTVDAAGDITTQAPHEWMLWLLENHTQLSPSDYDAAAIAALATAEAGEGLTFGRAVLDRVNVLTLFDEIALASRSWYAWGSDGVLTVGRLDLANLAGESADDEIDTGDIMGELSAENLPLQWGKVNVDARRNAAVQSDGLSIDTTVLTAEERSLWAQRHQVRVSSTDPGTTGYLANWWDYHKSAIDSRPIALEIDNGYQTACDEITDLFAPWTRVHRCQVGLDKYALNPGDCVTVTYPRYGLESGAKCRVISVRPRVSERVVDLVVVRQALPDYTTAVH